MLDGYHSSVVSTQTLNHRLQLFGCGQPNNSLSIKYPMSLQFKLKDVLWDCQIIEWFELEGTFKEFQHSSNLLSKAGSSSTRSGCQDPIQPDLEYFQGWGIHVINGQAVLISIHLHRSCGFIINKHANNNNYHNYYPVSISEERRSYVFC